MNAVLRFLAAHPERAFTTAEVKAAVPEYRPGTVACYLAQSAARGLLARSDVSCPRRGTRPAFQFLRPPMPRAEINRLANAARSVASPEEAARRHQEAKRREYQRARERLGAHVAAQVAGLQPPRPGPWGPLLGLFLINPAAWIAAPVAALAAGQTTREVGPTLARHARTGLLRQQGGRKNFRWQLDPAGPLAVWGEGGPALDLRPVRDRRGEAGRARRAALEARRQAQAQRRERQRAEQEQRRLARESRPAPDRTPRPLAPADPALHPTPVVALLLSNPGVWIDRYDAGCLGERLASLAYKGFAERRQGPRGHTEYRLLRPPPVRTSRPGLEASMNRPTRIRVQAPPAAPAPREVAVPKPRKVRLPSPEKVTQAAPPRPARPRPTGPTPAQLADRQRRAELKAQRLAAEAQAREERRLARQQERLAAAERKAQAEREQDRLTQQIRREDGETVRALLARAPGQDWSKGQIAAALGLSVGRVTIALQGLTAQGLIMAGTVEGTSRLLDPGLPEVPAVLTPLAGRVRGAMAGRAGETELGLVRLLGLTRAEVREGLAALRACGLLTWTGVNNLVVYRLEAGAGVRHVAA